MKKMLLIQFSLVLVLSLLAGCTRKDKGTEPSSDSGKQENTEPVTITIMQKELYIYDKMLQKMITEPLKKKYPYITVELIKPEYDMDTVVAAGVTFDLWATSIEKLPEYKELGITEDITPLAKKYNFDLNRFDQGILNGIRGFSDNRELIALPYTSEYNALYYNKDIFDRFDVPYPKDGMTWEETIELSKRLARYDGRTRYSGLDESSLWSLIFPFSLNYIDAKTNKILEPLDAYRKAFETGLSIHSIPNNVIGAGFQRFQAGTLAMLTDIPRIYTLINTTNMNWDVAQFPSYKDRPNTYGMSASQVLIPNKISKNKDAIMKVFEMLYSDEAQIAQVSEILQASVLTDPKYAEMFGSGVPQLKDKHISSIFKSKPAPGVPYSAYFRTASTIATRKYYDYLRYYSNDLDSILIQTKNEIERAIEISEKGK